MEVELDTRTTDSIGIITSSARFCPNSIAEFTSACFSGSNTPSSSIVSIMFSRSSSVTFPESSAASECDNMLEIPENKNDTGVHTRTKNCILDAKINEISSLLAFARLFGSISANKYTIMVVITVPYTTYSEEN